MGCPTETLSGEGALSVVVHSAAINLHSSTLFDFM